MRKLFTALCSLLCGAFLSMLCSADVGTSPSFVEDYGTSVRLWDIILVVAIIALAAGLLIKAIWDHRK